MSVSLRFTDQAVVATALARQWAAGEGRAATVRELILGLATSETYGLGAPGQADEMLSPVGARAVARTWAGAGGAVELVMMLADDPRDELGQWNLPPTDHLLFELERLEREGVPTDLLRAAVLAGGTGPLAILDAAAKPSPD